MPEIRRTAVVPCTVQQMYEIVDDVSQYPDFLGWCRGAAEETRRNNQVTAWLDLSRSGAQGRFRIRHDLVQDERVDLTILDGPIRDLTGVWVFEPQAAQCSALTLDVEYGRRGGLMAMMMAPLVAEIADGLLDAFRDRAVDLYGP